ncbi:UNVERIFIED_CONTAM: U-box domain-containing protein 9 [Sesamum radiatum]|uniref:RING-type E3 ubiquitin transferase n=1 Tax=Sesamum radiatum TaxID=300843 RepID=A0AAW2W4S5_SESRA
MAKSGVFEGDPTTVVKAVELKKELQKMVRAIVDEDDVNLEALDRAQQMLFALRELKLKKTVSLKLHNHHYDHEMASGTVPEEFKCPLSKELMRDPVIIATGQTYDKPFIQKWLKAGNRTCPLTQQVLSHTILTPNHLIREMITQWCKNHGIKLPDSVSYINEEGLTGADRDHFLSLLGKMSLTLSEQKEAAKELRLLTKRMPSFRALFGESVDAIPSCCLRFLKAIVRVRYTRPSRRYALKAGTIETRSNAAATLFTLSALDSNKALIGKSGALKPLIDLLDEGHPLAMKDVASAIFNLCIIHENKVRAVRDGAVRVILKKIMNRLHVDELLSILAMLSTNQKAIEEMGELEAVPCLLSIIRETSCDRNKENCIAILYTICFSDRSKWKVMREEESMYRTISQLAQNGTSRAKRKASGILERLNRAVNLTHTA